VNQKESAMQLDMGFLFRSVLIGSLGLLGVFSVGQATAASLEVLHADSLAGPMKEIKKAFEGKPELAQKIIQGAVVDPSKPNTVPETVRAVKEGKANAGVVYYSAAVAAKNDLEIIRFPASVNLSDKIRNAASVPGTARNEKVAMEFVKFLLSGEGQDILKETGQPPVVPAIRKGDVPAELK
jgi:ABC-type molybdate transport system substrate-binding protein